VVNTTTEQATTDNKQNSKDKILQVQSHVMTGKNCLQETRIQPKI